MRPRRSTLPLLVPALVSGLAAAQTVRMTVPSIPKEGPIFLPERNVADLRAAVTAAIDRYVLTYGTADYSPLLAHLRRTTAASPDDLLPFVSLGHAYLNRFEHGGDPDDFLQALGFFEIPARPDVWPAWGNRPGNEFALANLMNGLLRLRQFSVFDGAAWTRIAVLWDRVAQLAADEADSKLTVETPSQPYLSAATGHSMAGAYAAEAAFLAWTSALSPDHPRAAAWEEKGRLLASLSIVRESDEAFFGGMQVATIHEDFTLTDHDVSPNPYQAASTVMLLRLGALAYRMTGRPVPAEFHRNVRRLYRKYRTYCTLDGSGRWVWDLPSDPPGDPTLWPLPGLDDDDFVLSLVAQQLGDEVSWLPPPPTEKLFPGRHRWVRPESAFSGAIRNARIVLYYLDGAYLWLDPGPTTTAN